MNWLGFLLGHRFENVPSYNVSTMDFPRLDDFLRNWKEVMDYSMSDPDKYSGTIPENGWNLSGITSILANGVVISADSPVPQNEVNPFIRLYDRFDESEQRTRFDKVVLEGHKLARAGPAKVTLYVFYDLFSKGKHLNERG